MGPFRVRRADLGVPDSQVLSCCSRAMRTGLSAERFLKLPLRIHRTRLTWQLAFGREPIVQVLSVFAATREVPLVRTLRELLAVADEPSVSRSLQSTGVFSSGLGYASSNRNRRAVRLSSHPRPFVVVGIKTRPRSIRC